MTEATKYFLTPCYVDTCYFPSSLASSSSITFCSHYETISLTYKKLYQKIDKVEKEKLRLKLHIDTLLLKQQLSLQDIDLPKFYFNIKQKNIALPSYVQQ